MLSSLKVLFLGGHFGGVKSSQVYFIAIFKMRKKKQRKTIQSPSQPYLIASLETITTYLKCLRWH